MDALIPVLTNVGLAALIQATNDGVEGRLSHIAFGDGGGSNYQPSASQTELINERARVPIAGGQRAGNAEIQVQALLDSGPTFQVREVGFILDDGTFLAIWGNANQTLTTKTSGVPLAVTYNLALAGIPPGSLNLSLTLPSLNLTIAGPLAQLVAEIIRLQRRIVESENLRLIPIIQTTWR